MLTPPFHHSIVATPLTQPIPGQSPCTNQHILYRGSKPALRNFSFLDRLRVKTIVVLDDKPVPGDDNLATWATNRGVGLRWIKAHKMGEEKLGMGQTEVGDVLKIMLDSSVYPLYIADRDGKSHTTLVIACLRKLQEWHIDSIIGEMCR